MAPVAPSRLYDWHVLQYDLGFARDARTRQSALWWRVLFLDVFLSSLIKYWHLPASRLIRQFPVLYNYARYLGLLGGYCAAVNSAFRFPVQHLQAEIYAARALGWHKVGTGGGCRGRLNTRY